MTNSSGNTWISDSSIPNQAEGTKVYFKVFAEGENDDITETYRYMYEVKANVLCTPSMDCSYNDGFQLVQVGDIYTSTKSQRECLLKLNCSRGVKRKRSQRE